MGEKFININYPFKDSGKGFFLDLNSDTNAAIKADLMHLLLTRKGQRLYNPDFGTDLLRFIFEPEDGLTLNNIKDEIRTVVKRYLPNLTINEIKELQGSSNKSKRIKIAKELISSVTTIGQLPKDFIFPNIFNTCDSKGSNFNYCKNNKIIIEKSDFDNFVEVMANDMANEYKLKFMFDNQFYDNVINKNKFSTPIHEQIIVTI